METKDMTQEQISALLDGELSDAHFDVALAALRRNEGKETWDVYHQIGDVLRSEDMAQDFSAGFTSRLLARLDEEPPILAPAPQPVEQRPAQIQHAGNGRMMRYFFPTAAAAAAVFALVMAPQMMGKKGGDSQAGSTTVVLPAAPAGTTAGPIASADTDKDGTMVRDPRVDQYLLAHQRYSPSWNSSAEYARSATYTVTSDANK